MSDEKKTQNNDKSRSISESDLNVDRSTQEDVSKMAEEKERLDTQVQQTAARDKITKSEEKPNNEDSAPSDNVFYRTYKSCKDSGLDDVAARETAAQEAYKHNLAEDKKGKSSEKALKETFRQAYSTYIDIGIASDNSMTEGLAHCANSIDQSKANRLTKKAILWALADVIVELTQTKPQIETEKSVLATFEMFSKIQKTSEKRAANLAQKYLKKGTIKSESDQKDSLFKSALIKYPLVALLSFASIAGSVVAYDAYLVEQKKKEMFEMTMGQVSLDISNIYTHQNHSIDEKTTRAALAMAKIENIELETLVKIAQAVAQERGLSKDNLTDLVIKIKDIRELLKSNAEDGLILSLYAAKDAESKAKSINLTDSERTIFIIRSLTATDEATDEQIKTTLQTSPVFKGISDRDIANALLDVANDKKDADQGKQRVIALAAEMHAKHSIESSTSKGLTNEAALAIAINASRDFLSAVRSQIDVDQVIVNALKQAGVGDQQLRDQIAINRALDSAYAANKTGDAFIEFVKKEIESYAESEVMQYGATSVLVASAVNHAAVRQGASEEAAMGRGIAAGMTYVKQGFKHRDLADSIVARSTLSQVKKQKLAPALDVFFDLDGEQSHPLIPSAGSVVTLFTGAMRGDETVDDARSLSEVFVELVRDQDNSDALITKKLADKIEENISESTSTERAVQSLMALSRESEQEQGETALAIFISEATSKAFEASPLSAEKLHAKTTAIYLSSRGNLTQTETQMASKYAEQKVVARQAGLNTSEQSAVAERASKNVARQSGLAFAETQKSFAKVLSTLDVARSEEERSGDVARAQAEKQGKSLIEQELAAQSAMLDFRAAANSTPATVATIAKIMIEAKLRAEALSMNNEEASALINKAEKEAYAQLGMTQEMYRMIARDVQALSKIQKESVAEYVDDDANKVSLADATVQQQVLKLDIKLGQIEERLGQLTDVKRDIAKLTNEMDQISAAHSDFEDRIKVVIEDVYGGFAGSVDEYNQTLVTINKDLGRLRKNYGWLHNRQCETEGLSSNFKNEKTCGDIYARVNQDYRIAKSKKAGEAREIRVAQKVVQKAMEQAELKIATVKKQGAQKRVASVSNVCDQARSGWSYNAIWGSGASITRWDGQSIKITYGASVPELGDALFFQVNKEPKFIQFSGGIVCKKSEKS